MQWLLYTRPAVFQFLSLHMFLSSAHQPLPLSHCSSTALLTLTSLLLQSWLVSPLQVAIRRPTAVEDFTHLCADTTVRMQQASTGGVSQRSVAAIAVEGGERVSDCVAVL